jgi:hypothetical protein
MGQDKRFVADFDFVHGGVIGCWFLFVPQRNDNASAALRFSLA